LSNCFNVLFVIKLTLTQSAQRPCSAWLVIVAAILIKQKVVLQLLITAGHEQYDTRVIRQLDLLYIKPNIRTV